MKPIQFKYKKLYEIEMSSYSEKMNRKSEWMEFEGKGKRKVIAYQVFPKGDYSNHWKERGEEDFMITGYGDLNNHFCYNETKGYYELIFSKRNPLEPFLVGKNDWVTFRNCVTEYNRNYCGQSDIDTKVLDDFLKWIFDCNYIEYKTPCEEMVKEYKQTLESEYFEEIK